MREEEPRLGREGRWMRHAADSEPGRENVGGLGDGGWLVELVVIVNGCPDRSGLVERRTAMGGQRGGEGTGS